MRAAGLGFLGLPVYGVRPGGWRKAKLSHIMLYSFYVVTHSSKLTAPACSASPVFKGRGDFPTHLSLSDLHLLPIEYDRSLARSRIDLVEAITRYTNKPINCERKDVEVALHEPRQFLLRESLRVLGADTQRVALAASSC